MLTISPVLKDFPRNDLHVFVEGGRLGLERGIDRIRDSEAEVFERDGHLGGGLIAEVVGELLDVAYTRIGDLAIGDLLHRTKRYPSGLCYRRPCPLRILKL